VVADVAPAPGSILAPVGRQAAVLNLDAPRPRLLTSLQSPSYATDLDVSPTGQVAVEVARYDYLAGYGAVAWIP
jgi:hypothetical protein